MPLWYPPRAALGHVEGRAADLAQPRPEYGHATNAFCIVGRRERTRGLFLDRRAFLVSYDPTRDEDGTTLARILAAVVPVVAGISLEYYFSYVDPTGYGCGTKLPHNVTSLLGVMDGAQSDLRTGLPWQMVEIHEPVRLTMVVDTTPEILIRLAGVGSFWSYYLPISGMLAQSGNGFPIRRSRQQSFLGIGDNQVAVEIELRCQRDARHACVGAVVGDAVEEAEEPVVVGLRDRVRLVVVAARAADRDPEEGLRRRLRDVVEQLLGVRCRRRQQTANRIRNSFREVRDRRVFDSNCTDTARLIEFSQTCSRDACRPEHQPVDGHHSERDADEC